MEDNNNQMSNNDQMNNDDQLQIAIQGAKKAIQGEREDELFYDYLISEAPTNEEKEIISSIRDDERRHNMLFRGIYEDFTGDMDAIMGDEEEDFEVPESYLEGIKKALFGELAAVERYRAIRRGLPEGVYRDVLFDIITDELKHASKYNYLFTLNSIGNNSFMNRSLMRQDTVITENIDNTNDLTPDDWVSYIDPLVNRALTESKEGVNSEHLYQEFILSGVLVGLGKNPNEAMEQVEEWRKSGASKKLAMSKMSRYFNDLDNI
ncbi:ferritin-like domain-containing protein [Clostridium beijerinckii]|uniref:Rubrerythrin n=1 Tax=Clostridium beijerinckii TaxID=1520 RepID=A0AAX0AUI7_CLOBE|nr:ferritin-like domain-containing protein [Clostridium beijerinckii]NRT86674.1 rubrerythrin [Clostridium beijerinckii]NYC72107.1 rubrerythrin [Clostridium beijerinckii]